MDIPILIEVWPLDIFDRWPVYAVPYAARRGLDRVVVEPSHQQQHFVQLDRCDLHDGRHPVCDFSEYLQRADCKMPELS